MQTVRVESAKGAVNYLVRGTVVILRDAPERFNALRDRITVHLLQIREVQIGERHSAGLSCFISYQRATIDNPIATVNQRTTSTRVQFYIACRCPTFGRNIFRPGRSSCVDVFSKSFMLLRSPRTDFTDDQPIVWINFH
ncbi:hypothetical protein ABIE91_008455 [Bradyrhizobium elkanii]